MNKMPLLTFSGKKKINMMKMITLVKIQDYRYDSNDNGGHKDHKNDKNYRFSPPDCFFRNVSFGCLIPKICYTGVY